MYLALNPDAICNIHTYRINRTKINTPQRQEEQPRGVNKWSLKDFRTTNLTNKDPMSNIRIVTLNVRSVKNKDQMIVQELAENNIDMALITETWTKDTQEDQAWLNQSELFQGQYEIPMHNRPGEKGVAVLH